MPTIQETYSEQLETLKTLEKCLVITIPDEYTVEKFTELVEEQYPLKFTKIAVELGYTTMVIITTDKFMKEYGGIGKLIDANKRIIEDILKKQGYTFRNE